MANKEWIKKGADGLTFGERLEDLIKLNKTTATALAKDTGLAQSAISDYLNKDRAPDCATIYALARHFSVSADYLLGIEPIPATDLTTRDIHRKTGLSEKNISRLLKAENHTSGLSYADFVNMCLDATYLGRANFYMLAEAMASRMVYKKSKADSGSDLPLSPDEYIEMVNAMDAADKQAQAVGCKLMSHDESIRFYAREIASDLERYLLGVFNNGND
jgi:transcriptional regulator with XRE-family HTH domain